MCGGGMRALSIVCVWARENLVLCGGGGDMMELRAVCAWT